VTSSPTGPPPGPAPAGQSSGGNRPDRTRSWQGWGYEDAAATDEQVGRLAAAIGGRFGIDPPTPATPVELDDIELRPSRVAPPDALAHLCSTGRRDRAAHTYGRSYRDTVRLLRGDLPHPPDLVAHPADEADVVALLDWCSSAGIAAIPFGGGSSVVGGVEADVGDDYPGVVSLDMTRMDRVVEIDRTSRAARIQAGALGPVLEAQLRPHGLTLRHYPQSFEFSTLGGWLATRAGGHFATVYTHIDDLCESMRVVTPVGTTESRRLPGSGAGPSPDRLFLGSEGALGVITEAWMRLQDRPRWKTSAGVEFPELASGAEAVRALAQSGLFPVSCRLLDAGEAMLSARLSPGAGALLVLGFESADHPVDAPMDRALELCRDHGGTLPEPATSTDGGVPGRVEPTSVQATAAGTGRDGAAGEWRNSFLRAPYTRDALVRLGIICETFETACTWDRFPTLHAAVTTAVEDALRRICGAGWVTCRFTHAYPDGVAPYFSVLAPGTPGSELSQWAEIKAAASEALLAAGGTITHHRAVGRDHRPWYDVQRPDVFATALRAAKSALDPAGILNPGVLIDR
jgi:alkyldihydroxyacetonephosphate synthase